MHLSPSSQGDPPEKGELRETPGPRSSRACPSAAGLWPWRPPSQPLPRAHFTAPGRDAQRLSCATRVWCLRLRGTGFLSKHSCGEQPPLLLSPGSLTWNLDQTCDYKENEQSPLSRQDNAASECECPRSQSRQETSENIPPN